MLTKAFASAGARPEKGVDRPDAMGGVLLNLREERGTNRSVGQRALQRDAPAHFGGRDGGNDVRASGCEGLRLRTLRRRRLRKRGREGAELQQKPRPPPFVFEYTNRFPALSVPAFF